MYGKLIGGIIGGAAALLAAWPPEAVALLAGLGAIAGHFVIDREPVLPKVEQPKSIEELIEQSAPRPRAVRRAARTPSLLIATPEQISLARTLCPLFVEVARADAAMSQLEVRVVREFFEDVFDFDAAGREEVRLALKASLGRPVQNLEELVKVARGEVKPQLRLDVVRGLYDLAMCDGELTMSETNVLRQIVQHFNLSDEQLQQITKLFFGSGAEHYTALGLQPSASDDEVRSAFRKLAAENHPDRVASLGAVEAAAAGERFRQVKDAYDALKKLRGL